MNILKYCNGKVYDGKMADRTMVRYHYTFNALGFMAPFLFALFFSFATSYVYQYFFGTNDFRDIVLFSNDLSVFVEEFIHLLLSNQYNEVINLYIENSWLIVIATISCCFFFLCLYFSPFGQLYDASKSHSSGKIVSTLPYIQTYMHSLVGYGGVFLGFVKNVPITVKEPLSTLVYAPPGTGKTISVIIPTILNDPNSQIIFDVKGELYQKTSKYRATLGPVGYIDFSDSKNSLKWNPLSYRTLPDVKEGNKSRPAYIYNKDGTLDLFSLSNAEKLLRQIAKIIYPETGKDPYWSQMAGLVFIAVGSYLYVTEGSSSFVDISETSNVNDKDVKFNQQTGVVSRLTRKEKFEKLANELEEYMMAIGVLEGAVEKEKKDSNALIHEQRVQEIVSVQHTIKTLINTLYNISALPDLTFGSIISNFDNALDGLVKNPHIRSISEDSHISFNNLRGEKGKPITLYLKVANSEVSIFAPYIRIFFEMASNFILDNEWKKKEGQKMITLCLDEFSSLGELQRVLELPKLSRGQGARVLFVAQSSSQVEKIYGKELANTLYSVCSFMLYFTQNDDATKKMVSESLGSTTVIEYKQSVKSSNKLTSDVDYSENSYEGRLLTPDDVGSIPNDTVYCVAQNFNNRPLKAKTAFNVSKKRFLGNVLHKRYSEEPLDKNHPNLININPQVIESIAFENPIKYALELLKKSESYEKNRKHIDRLETLLKKSSNLGKKNETSTKKSTKLATKNETSEQANTDNAVSTSNAAIVNEPSTTNTSGAVNTASVANVSNRKSYQFYPEITEDESEEQKDDLNGFDALARAKPPSDRNSLVHSLAQAKGFDKTAKLSTSYDEMTKELFLISSAQLPSEYTQSEDKEDKTETTAETTASLTELKDDAQDNEVDITELATLQADIQLIQKIQKNGNKSSKDSDY